MNVSGRDRFGEQAEKIKMGGQFAHSDHFAIARGEFEIRRWRGPVGEGKIFDIPVHDTNLVVTMARRQMSRLIGGAINGATISIDGTDYPLTTANSLFITQMRWGTGGHNPATPTIPIPPSTGDEALTAGITTPLYKAVTVDYPTDMSIRFTATLDLDEANGEGLSEEGLFATGEGAPVLFARKTFGLLTKTPDFSFEFRHTIIF